MGRSNALDIKHAARPPERVDNIPESPLLDWRCLPVSIQYTGLLPSDGFVLPLARVMHNWMPAKSRQAAPFGFRRDKGIETGSEAAE